MVFAGGRGVEGAVRGFCIGGGEHEGTGCRGKGREVVALLLPVPEGGREERREEWCGGGKVVGKRWDQ